MGVPVKTEFALTDRTVAELELSLIIFLSHTFPEMVVGPAENYLDKLDRFLLNAETRAAFLVQHERTAYTTYHRLTDRGLVYSYEATYDFTVLVLEADKDEALLRLNELRAAAPHYFPTIPTEMPDWILVPQAEQYEGKVEELHHYCAQYTLCRSRLPGLAESRMRRPDR